MKTLIILLVGWILTTWTLLHHDKKTFKKLYALEGTWKMNTPRGSLCEEWKKTAADILQGKGYRIKGNDTTISERVMLQKKAKDIFYTSTVEDQNNRQPISFKLTKSEDNIFIFENPEHDFPKRIVYHLIRTDSLHCWIDDGVDGSKKKQQFFYRKQ